MLLFNNSFEIFGLTINYYGLISALGYLVGVIVSCFYAKKRGFKADDIITLACFVIPLGVVLYCVIFKKNFLKLADVVVAGLVLGQGIGRWGNFVNQEAFGYYIDNPSMQWFPFGVYIEHCHQPGCACPGYGWHLATFFYEFINNTIIFIILSVLLFKVRFKNDGIVASCYLIMYGFCRFIVEGLRMDSLYLGPFRLSQLLSIVFIICGIAYIVFCAIRNKRKKTPDEIIRDVLKNDLK